jgi:O-acetyl-ADP-ribose deacetylase (regulator of RNase III)
LTVTERIVAGRVLAVMKGDITRVAADAIVNAANDRLAGGAGVDGAIHSAGGRAIMADLEARYGPLGRRRCPTGGAVLTIAGGLPARWVVHAVGPIWRGGGAGEEELLRSSYATAFRLADEAGARSIAFPSISTGVYGYPVELAAPVALGTVRGALETARSIQRATFVLYSESTERAFADSLEVI